MSKKNNYYGRTVEEEILYQKYDELKREEEEPKTWMLVGCLLTMILVAGADFFTAWKNSAGHNANMLRGTAPDGTPTFQGFAVSVVEYNGYWFAVTSFRTNY